MISRIFCHQFDLTCKRGSVGQSEGLSIPRSSVRFRQKPDNSNSHEFELHRPSNKGTKLLLKVIKAIIIIKCSAARPSYAVVQCLILLLVCAVLFVITFTPFFPGLSYYGGADPLEGWAIFIPSVMWCGNREQEQRIHRSK